MCRTQRKAGPRAGFTLIELLVVIAIIAVLVSLTSAAVMRVWASAIKTAARVEISDLEKALNNTKLKYGLPYIPSRLVLYRNPNNYTRTNANDVQSRYILGLMFPEMFNTATATTNIPWNGQAGPITDRYVLHGQQCLVFFAGGIPDTTGGSNSCAGFNEDKTNPAAPGGARFKPGFEFKSARLTANTHGFFAYQDPYGKGQNYVFFSSYSINGTENGYVATDCGGTAAAPTFQPYHLPGATTRFLNSTSFQILCAGADGLWDTTWTWDPANGTTAPNDLDNQANFAPGTLLNGQ